MGLKIEDGTGDGYSAKVNSQNKLLTNATISAQGDVASIAGDGFNASTGLFSLTNTVESGIIYILNDYPDKILVVDLAVLSLGNSAAATTPDVITRSYKNPTGGTLLSAGTLTTPTNRNFGSSLPARATVRTVSAVGQTVTGGQLISGRVTQRNTNVASAPGWILPPGTSVALTVQPGAGNTAMDIWLVASFYFIHADDF